MQAQNIRPSFKCFLTLYRRYEARKVCCIVLIAMCMPAVNQVHADTLVSDKFRIALGGYSVYRYDSVMSLTDSNLGAGISISPEDTLGLKTEQSVVRLDGHYRFTDEDALTYSWYRIKSNGIKSLQESFDWIDENGNPITIPVGAVVDTVLDYDILKLGYLWSFYRTGKVELAVGAGQKWTPNIGQPDKCHTGYATIRLSANS